MRGVYVAAVMSIWSLTLPSALSFSQPRPSLIASHSASSRAWSLAAISEGGEKSEDDGSSAEQSDEAEETTASVPAVPRGPPPVKEVRMDPLIASLTRTDPQTADAKSINVPLLGEFPIDGSVVVLAPAAIIAVLGFVMSINIAFNSKDVILSSVQGVGEVMSTPPVMKTTVRSDGCRGLCSSQESDLEGLRSFMGRFAKDQ